MHYFYRHLDRLFIFHWLSFVTERSGLWDNAVKALKSITTLSHVSNTYVLAGWHFFELFLLWPAIRNVKLHMVHSLIWWWACATLDTEAEWGTIMKHHVIKVVPDKLSRVWWASVSLWISRAPQLISHQGGAQGARSLKPSITTLEGRQSPAYFHVSSTPTPNLRLSNQGAQMTREVLDGSKGGWRVQSTVRKKDKRNERARNFWFCKRFFSSHLISLKNHEWIGNTKGADWMRLNCFPTSRLIRSWWLGLQIEMQVL